MGEKPNILYHYCSTDSLVEIIKNKCLWLSDVSQSNDAKEGRLAIDLWSKALKKDYHCTEKQLQLLRRLYDLRMAEITCFGTCFSKHEDRLSQWRGYGEDGTGFAIGFNKEWLNNQSYPKGMRTAQVEYFRESAPHRITLYTPGIEASLPPEKDIDLDAVSKNSHPGVYAHFQTLGTEIPYYIKSNFFHEEHEHRLMYQREQEDEGPPTIHYRTSNNRIIPYIELPLPNDEDGKQIQSIKEIWCGPKNTIPDSTIKGLLGASGFSPKIKIKRSEGSYR